MQCLNLHDQHFDALDRGELNHMVLKGWQNIRKGPLIFVATINRERQRLVIVMGVQHTHIGTLKPEEIARFNKDMLGSEELVTVVYFK